MIAPPPLSRRQDEITNGMIFVQAKPQRYLSGHASGVPIAKADLWADPWAELAETRAEIVRWVAGLIGFQTLAISGAVAALSRTLH